MAASSFQLFILAVNGRAVKHTKDMEAIYKTLSVSADGEDNGLTISESSGHFGFNSKKLTGVAQGAASGEVVTLGAGNKIPTSLLPALAITDVFVVADLTARDALTIGSGDGEVQEGDVAVVQSDSNFDDQRHSYIYDGSAWQSLNDGAAVSSVNGETGDVILDTDDVDEGVANLYFTNARFDTQLATKDTGDLAEGSNLYFTNARAIAAPLTGYSKGAGTVAATDTILQAIQKLDGNDDLKQDKSDLYRSLTNKEGGSTAHTIRQIAYLSAFGQAKLAQATAAGLSEKTVFLMVRDSSITDDAAGTYWMPKKGTVIGGFADLVFDEPVYLSRTAAGGYQVTAPATANDHVVRIGYAISATEIQFDPQYEYQVA